MPKTMQTPKVKANPQRRREDGSLQEYFLSNLDKVWHIFKPIS